jgi:hypothetical protein
MVLQSNCYGVTVVLMVASSSRLRAAAQRGGGDCLYPSP